MSNSPLPSVPALHSYSKHPICLWRYNMNDMARWSGGWAVSASTFPFHYRNGDPAYVFLARPSGTFFRWEGAITQICCYRIFSVSLRTQPDAAANLVIVGSVCPALEWGKLNGATPDHHFDPSADWRTADLAV